MNKKNFLSLFAFINLIFSAYSQNFYSPLTVSPELKENANSIIRKQNIIVELESKKKYKLTKKIITSVYNESGLENLDLVEYYSSSNQINNISVQIYDIAGKAIKKFRKADFKDRSVADGLSLLSDGRIIYLDYTPVKYPFTIEYEVSTTSENTAFLPIWIPVTNFNESIEESTFQINYSDDLGFKYKESAFKGYEIEKEDNANVLRYKLKNFNAAKNEELAPSGDKIFPRVRFSVQKFMLEGVEGDASNWKEFGKIWYEKLINDDTQLSEKTIAEINDLVKDLKDPVEKAKKVYEYVQNKTRYVSIQLGIGGWKPMSAEDVDKLGYGDCKALSNYTRKILNHVGIESYYTIIYGDRNRRHIDGEFVSQQGNHAILTMPIQNKNYFLECTSQTAPFAFGGDFTDDRDALVVKPEGGEIVKTNKFSIEDNYQKLIGEFVVDNDGKVEATCAIFSGGIQYNDKSFLEREKDYNQRIKHYKERFDWINGLELKSVDIVNDKNKIEFQENINFKSANYTSKAGNTLFFAVNLFNNSVRIPSKYRNRKYDFEIKRGYFDSDEIKIKLPEGYSIDYFPENQFFENEFGVYKFELKKINEYELILKRELKIKEGYFEKEKYNDYRLFKEKIAKIDNSKIILIKK